MKIHEKLKKLGNHLEGGLVGRRDHARMLLLAAVAGENAILFGPPGTAKSLLARRLKDCFADDIRYFECLLTKFSMPEEVFGPVSLRGLEQDIFRRVYDRYMPGAGVAFIDETFKANSAILNSMLTILNEREFDTGNERIKVPLRCVVGASNEMPKESELEALYDRFIIRMRVDRLQDEEQLTQFLTNTVEYVAPEAELRLSKAELEVIANNAKALPVEEPVIELLIELREWCHGKGIKVSDRRLIKIKRLLQVAAVTSGRESTSLSDSWVIRHCAWDDFTSEQAEKLAEWLDSRIDKQQHNLSGLLALVDAEVKACEAKSKVHKKDSKSTPVYIDSSGAETTKATLTGYIYDENGNKDDNGGLFYSADEIKQKLKTSYRYGNGDCIVVASNWVELEEYFKKNYAGKVKKIAHKPKFENGVYTVKQQERFKESSADVLKQLTAKRAEIKAQIEKLALSLDASPWTPKEYQESYLAGLNVNLEQLGKCQNTLQGVIADYDKLLTTSDTEKLTDPTA